MHEIDHSGGIEGEKMKAVTVTPWAVEMMAEEILLRTIKLLAEDLSATLAGLFMVWNPCLSFTNPSLLSMINEILTIS